MKKALLLVSVFALSFSVASSSRHKNKDDRHGAIIRLYVKDDNGNQRFFCSGTVITDQYILTAAHCVVRLAPFTVIEIRDETLEPIGAGAIVTNVNPRGDVALLMGNFYNFKHIKLSRGASNTMDHFLDNNRKTQACGYPWGAELTCVSLENKRYTFSMMNGIMGIRAKGWLMPGMSGGPVIDLKSGEIVGVNTAADEEAVFLSPVAGLGAMFEIDEEQL